MADIVMPSNETVVGETITWGQLQSAIEQWMNYTRIIQTAGRNEVICTVSGTFVVPANVTRLEIDAAAGGGGGSSFYSLGGGGGECVRGFPLDVTPGESIEYTIGAGGLGSTIVGSSLSIDTYYGMPADYSGRDGGNTLFGGYLTLHGGKGGYAPAGSISQYHGGLAGGPNANSGQYLIAVTYNDTANKLWQGGRGGDCLFGSGGVGGYYTSSAYVGTNGIGFGSGGGGGGTQYASSLWSFSAGGNGANGFIRIRY